ncbi:glycosyltransferase [Tessaracoccus antarcticus]|uniref:Glycosyltransferase n=1 Tax=Tessaracoccus antarcticus TaxID=2479848 RepID=A0A3M0G8I9_9ACTN|nr:glycosyltransferase [Tessaracoccus antarcticus]RMB61224.1 glycosyltransferase [Tessaracoccus antarcticus]
MADARLHRTSAALRRAGFDVSIRGLGDAALGPRECEVVAEAPVGKLRRGLRALLWPWQARADVLVTIDPDPTPSAWLASKARRMTWVADVHEDYRALLKDRSWVPKPLLMLLQSAVSGLTWATRHADLVLVADEHVPPRRAPLRYVMRNEPDFTLLPEMATHVDDGAWRAVYIGDNRRSRGLQTMVEAIALTAGDDRPWELDIVGPAAGDDREWLESRLQDPDCSRIRFHGRQEPKQSWAIAEGADIGFCMLANTPAFAEAMPSKIYEYLACGLPTIATPLPRVAELLHRTGAGAIVESPEETARVLRRYATDPLWRADLVAAAREAGEVARTRRNTYDEAASRIAGLVSAG